MDDSYVAYIGDITVLGERRAVQDGPVDGHDDEVHGD